MCIPHIHLSQTFLELYLRERQGARDIYRKRKRERERDRERDIEREREREREKPSRLF